MRTKMSLAACLMFGLLVVIMVTPSQVVADTVDVAIVGFAFSADTITVPVGTTVRWTNQDVASHTSTSDPGGAIWDSGTLSTGQDYSYTFNSTGDFPYLCTIHPSMKGMVKVSAAAAVPGLSGGSLLALILSLLVMGVFLMRRYSVGQVRA